MSSQLSDVLTAAGEPTRLRILNLLRRESICVCDLQALLEIPQPTVSRHLAALRHAGLVRDDRNGTRVVYSWVRDPSPQIKALYEILDNCSSYEATLREDLSRLRRMKLTETCTAAEDEQQKEHPTP